MTLFKTSFWTSLATLVRLGSVFIIAKVLALFIGPVGFAYVGQFQNFTQMVFTFSGSMIQAGIVKHIAEHKENKQEKIKILSTGFVICIVSSLLMSVILIFFRKNLAILVLRNSGYSWVILVLAMTLIFYVLNTFLIAILNGEGAIKRMMVINMITSLFGLMLTGLLTYFYALSGALLAIVLGQSLVFFLTIILMHKTAWFKVGFFIKGLNKVYTKKLFQYALMAVASAVMLPITQIIIRSNIGHTLSWEAAGYWQAITRISDAYLLLVTSTLSVYFLPKLSMLQDSALIRKEIFKGYQFILPTVILMALFIFLLRHQLILLLFSPAFLPMQNLFLFQLIGDVFKVGSWLIAYSMLAKAMIKLFIVTEIVFTLSFGILAIVFIKFFGLKGVTIAFSLNYLVYWIFMGRIFYKKFSRNTL